MKKRILKPSIETPLGCDRDSPSKAQRVGIFWVVDGRLILVGVPLEGAEDYGVCKNYPSGHHSTWADLQVRNAAPREAEYEEYPRGRALYNTALDQFYLYADACILRRSSMVRKIRTGLNLPASTKIGPDAHYRCAVCLGWTSPQAED